MDLKKIKYIKNTGKLPEFANGMSPMDQFFSNGFPRKQQTSFVDPGNTFADKYAPTTKKVSFPTSFVDPGNTFANKYAPATKAATGEAMEKALKPSALSDVASKVGDVGAGLLGLASQYINGSRPVASADDFFKNARITQGNLGEYMYDILGDGGESQAMDQVRSNATANTLAMAGSGAVTGAAVGGPIGAGVGFLVGGIGGLFSGNKAKKEQEKQIRLASISKNDKNVYGHDLAYTNMLRDQFSKEYGDQESQQLYANAANGKRPVWTPGGLAALEATAHVSNGEVVGNLAEGVATRIPGRKNNKDTKLASLADGDFVISNKYGLSDYAAATGDYIGALNLQEMLLGGMRNKHGYKNGKLPGLKDGFSLSATLPSIFNTAIGLDQISRSNDMLSAPSSYRSNRYEGLLGGLDDIIVNTLPIYNNNKNLEAKTRNAIVRSGGLSAGQIAAALQSGGYNTMLANANALMNAQLQNNQYRTNAITTKYNAGAKDAALQSATSQWDYDKYAAAHNAAMQQNQMGFYNIANAWREGYKNNWDREQFEKMYRLYFADNKNKAMYYNFLVNGGMNNKPVPFVPKTKTANTYDHAIKDMQKESYIPVALRPTLPEYYETAYGTDFADKYAPFNIANTIRAQRKINRKIKGAKK